MGLRLDNGWVLCNWGDREWQQWRGNGVDGGCNGGGLKGVAVMEK